MATTKYVPTPTAQISTTITAQDLINKSRETIQIENLGDFCQTVARYFTSGMDTDNCMEALRQSYIHGFENAENGDDYDPREIAELVMMVATAQLDAVRTILTDQYVDSETKWTDYEGYNKIQSRYTTLRQETRKIADKWTWCVTGRVKPREFAEGKRNVTALQAPGQVAAKRKVTAQGKSPRRKAQGAPVDTPENGATTLEKVAGDRDTALAALQQICKAHPDLILEQAKRGGCLYDVVEGKAKKVNNVAAAKRKAS